MQIGSSPPIGSGIAIDRKATTLYVHDAEEKARLEAEGWETKLVPLSVRQLTDAETAADQANKAKAEATLRRTLRMPDNSPGNLWGQIVIGDRVIGEIYKTGAASTPSYIELKAQDSAGRAKEIMRVFGGYLRKPHQIPNYDEWLRTESAKMAKAVAKSAEEMLESIEKQHGPVSEDLVEKVADFKKWAETAFAEPDLAAQLANEIMQVVAQSVENAIADRIVEAVAEVETTPAWAY